MMKMKMKMKMKKKMKRTLLAALAAGMTMTSLAAEGIASAEQVDQTSYALETTYAFENKVPTAKPLWSADLDPLSVDNKMMYPPVVGDKNLYYVKGGTLVARSITTGKTLWSFGSKLQPGSAVVAGSLVYVAGVDGTVYKVNPATGKGTRIYRMKEAAGLFMVDGARLYAASGGALASVSLDTGKENWRITQTGGQFPPILLGDMLLVHAIESGALTVDRIYALDKATGKTLWQLGGSHGQLLKADGDRLYFNSTGLFSDAPTYIATIDVVDRSTGRIVASKKYGPTDTTIDKMLQYPKQIFIEGNDLSIVTRFNSVLEYDLNAEQDTAAEAQLDDSGDFAAGPYDGKFFFRNEDKLGVHARRPGDRGALYYQGLDNPASRIDLIKSGMYVGQTDGEVYALNVATGEASFRFQTQARNYGPFQVAGNTLLAQAEGKLYAFRLPDELAKPLGTVTAGEFAKTDAGLIVDGKAMTFQPSMMTSKGRMFVPMRFLMQAIGAKVGYDAVLKQSTVSYGKTVIAFTENSAFAVKDGKKMPLSHGPVTLNGSLYVPIGDLNELLGIAVTWNAAQRSVVVKTKAAS